MTKRWWRMLLITFAVAVPVVALAKHFIALMTVLMQVTILEMMTVSMISLSSPQNLYNAGSKDTMDLTKYINCDQSFNLKNISSEHFVIERLEFDCTMIEPLSYPKGPINSGTTVTLTMRHKKIKKIVGNISEGEIKLHLKCGSQQTKKIAQIHFKRSVKEENR